MWEGFSTISFESIHKDLRTVGAQGGRIEDPHFRRAVMLVGGALIKEGPTLIGDPSRTPIYYNPYYEFPSKLEPLIFGNPRP